MESWNLKNKLERTLMTWDRKILRKTYGSAYESSSWRIKMNQEIYYQFQYRGILTVINVRILESFAGCKNEI